MKKGKRVEFCFDERSEVRREDVEMGRVKEIALEDGRVIYVPILSEDIRVTKAPPSTWAQSVREEISGMVDRRVDQAVEVLAELPPSVMEKEHPFIGLREAWGYVEGEFLRFHYCVKCGGWIKGQVREGYVSDLRPLSGRRGVPYSCARCGYEIAFNGVVS